MKPLPFHLHSAGVLAPGLASLADVRAACLRGTPPDDDAVTLPAPARLPPNERRRASRAVRLTLACIEQALEGFPETATELRSVFATDEGTGEICPAMLDSLHRERVVSPLHFTNSVHNAPSGYFSIAWQNHQPATVVSLGDESFASGLLCAVTEALTTSAPVLLVTYDTALPEPLDELLPIHRHSAAAWVISDGARRDLPSLASLRLDLADAGDSTPLPAWLPASWRGNCSARAVAALALLDAPADHALHLGLNGRRLTLTRDDGGTA